ncbi:MAG: response regulator transcription factor [Bdellovibrionales bacterium]|nr:response regulator transcription factor [Bdellovibrionales bacterium]
MTISLIMNTENIKLIIACTDSNFLADKANRHMDAFKKDFKVQLASSAKMMLFLAKEWEPQICIIDGDSEIIESLEDLRKLHSYSNLGIIVLSKQNNIIIEEKSFFYGADHHIQTPCKYNSIKWRIKNLLYRMQDNNFSEKTIPLEKKVGHFNIIEIGNIHIYPKDYIVKMNEKIINTTPTQFKLLLAFANNKDHLLSRTWLKQTVWENSDISPRSIDAQISKLKKLLPELDLYLANIYGKGYIFSLSAKHSNVA